jgi:hypothetical protein
VTWYGSTVPRSYLISDFGPVRSDPDWTPTLAVNRLSGFLSPFFDLLL